MERLNLLIAFSITIILWGSAFPAIKIALNNFDAINLSTLRLCIASIILIIYVVLRKLPLPELKDIPSILLLGFCGFTVYHTLLNVGEKFVSAGIASLIISTTPIISSLLAQIFLKEKLIFSTWLGSLISFGGVVLISIGPDQKIQFVGLGIIFILTASLGESIYFTFQSKLLNKYGFIPLTIYTIISGTLLLLFFLPQSIEQLYNAEIESITALIYLAVFPTILPYIALAYTIKKIGVADSMLSLYVTPAVTLFLSFFMLHEKPNLLTLLGGIIIFLGIALTTKKSNNHR